VTICLDRLFARLARALTVCVVALSLAPAVASARPDRDPAAAERAQTEQADTGDLDWVTVTLAGGAIALLVVGALGVAAADDRRYLPTNN
jgi:hypothetical protein